MRRNILLLVIILPMLLILTSCKKQIEDVNGEEDYSLNTITDEDFFKNSNFTKFGSVTSKINHKTTFKVKKMSGVETLEKINLSSGNLNIKTNLKITSGNIKLVLIYNDEIIKEFKINDGDSYIAMTNGTYYLKVATESANFSLEYTIVK